MKRALIVGVLFLAAIAVAAGESVGMSPKSLPSWFQFGIYLGPLSTGQGNTTDKLTRTTSATAAHDFGNITAGGNDEFNITLNPNALVGDPCVLGTDVALDRKALLRCRVNTAGQARVIVNILAPLLSDGGLDAVDLPDASYTVRTFSSQ